MDLINKNFQQDISELLDSARKQAKTAVNLSMVYAYYEIGRRIYEEEQQGKERADYGKYLLKELSEYLLKRFGKGFSVTNLKQMRKFYLTYVDDQIGQTVSDQFKNLPTVSSGRKFFLSWSHQETQIIDHLQKFLLELGTGFAFIGRQVRFTFNEEHFRVDLVFYNRLLRCFVLFDLKIGKLKHQDIFQ